MSPSVSSSLAWLAVVLVAVAVLDPARATDPPPSSPSRRYIRLHRYDPRRNEITAALFERHPITGELIRVNHAVGPCVLGPMPSPPPVMPANANVVDVPEGVAFADRIAWVDGRPTMSPPMTMGAGASRGTGYFHPIRCRPWSVKGTSSIRGAQKSSRARMPRSPPAGPRLRSSSLAATDSSDRQVGCAARDAASGLRLSPLADVAGPLAESRSAPILIAAVPSSDLIASPDCHPEAGPDDDDVPDHVDGADTAACGQAPAMGALHEGADIRALVAVSADAQDDVAVVHGAYEGPDIVSSDVCELSPVMESPYGSPITSEVATPTHPFLAMDAPIASIDSMETLLQEQIRIFHGFETDLESRVRDLIGDLHLGRRSSRNFGLQKSQITTRANTVVARGIPDLLQIGLDHVLTAVLTVDVTAVDSALIPPKLAAFADQLADAVTGRAQRVLDAAKARLAAAPPALVRRPILNAIRRVEQQVVAGVHARLGTFRGEVAERFPTADPAGDGAASAAPAPDTNDDADPLPPTTERCSALEAPPPPVCEAVPMPSERSDSRETLNPSPPTPALADTETPLGVCGGLPPLKKPDRKRRLKPKDVVVVEAPAASGSTSPTVTPEALATAMEVAMALESAPSMVDEFVELIRDLLIDTEEVVSILTPVVVRERLQAGVDLTPDTDLIRTLDAGHADQVTAAFDAARPLALAPTRAYQREALALFQLLNLSLGHATLKTFSVKIYSRILSLLDDIRMVWLHDAVGDAVDRYVTLAGADAAAARRTPLPSAIAALVDLGRAACLESLRDLVVALPSADAVQVLCSLKLIIAQVWTETYRRTAFTDWVETRRRRPPSNRPLVTVLEPDAHRSRPPLTDADQRLLDNVRHVLESMLRAETPLPLSIQLEVSDPHLGHYRDQARASTPAGLLPFQRDVVDDLVQLAIGSIHRAMSDFARRLAVAIGTPIKAHADRKLDDVGDDDDALRLGLAQVVCLITDAVAAYRRVVAEYAAQCCQALLSDRLIARYKQVLDQVLPSEAPIVMRARDIRAQVRLRVGGRSVAKFKTALVDGYGGHRLLLRTLLLYVSAIVPPRTMVYFADKAVAALATV